MITILQVYAETPGGLVGYRKQVGIIPSQGLIIYQPIYGVIHDVVFRDGQYVARLKDVIQPTDTASLNFLNETGWERFDL